jgi:catechol 2,3-dioxygenase-like lactoylglutathione lyase family enzyme
LTSTDSHRPGVTSFVHVGLVVEDLDETVRFLALLGFDCGEPGVFSGEWIDQIIGDAESMLFSTKTLVDFAAAHFRENLK